MNSLTPALSRPRKTARATLAVALLALALPISNTVRTSTASAVAPPSCGTSGTPNVVALADPHYYIDSSSGLASTYAGYTVRTGSTAANQLWMKLSSFTGGVISLAPSQPAATALPNVAANSQTTAYYLLQASAATTAPQTHTISLFSGNPDLGALVCQRTFTYNGVFETIKALANKVTSVSVPPMAEATVGDLITVTVQGATGTLGAGPSYDPGVLSYAPNALSSFPSGSWRLERTEMEISPDGVAPQQTYINRLFLSGASGPNRNYTARYSFRAIAPSAAPAQVGPIQYIASGTQVKHTDVAGGVVGALPAISSTANIDLTKAAAPTTLTASGGTVSYTVSIKNFGSSAGTVDRVVDTIPAGATYVASSSKMNNRAIADPNVSGSALEWPGPIVIAAGGTTTLTYDLTIPASAGSHTNSVIGWFGSSQLDSSRDLTASAPATATVTVAQAPGPVNASDDSASTAARQPVNIQVLSNDSSGNGDPLSVSSVGTPSNGTATKRADNTIDYTPAAGFSGTATFTYTATDGNNSDSATVSVTVSPLARPDTYTTPKNTVLTVAAASGVLTNDDCTSCTVSLVTGPTVADAFTLNPDGSFTYDAPNQTGSDNFTYRVTAPGGLTSDAVAYISINAAGPDYTTTAYDTNATLNHIGNDTCSAPLSTQTAPTNGSVAYSSGNGTYNPNAGFWGIDTYQYKCTGSNIGNATVLVAPPAVTKQTTFNAPVSGMISSTGFFTDITTIACASCSYSLSTAPSNGSVSITAATGAFTYTPNDGYAGLDSFSYRVTDDNTGLNITSTVSVKVGPDAVADSTTMLVRNSHSISPLGNDSCPTTCTVTITQQPSSGTLTPNGDGTFSYSTAPQHEVGLFTFTYQVESSVAAGVTDSATVSILVEAAVDDTATANPGTPLVIDVQSNDPCSDCSIEKTSNPLAGTAVLEANGTFTYTAPATFSGVETFTYTRSKNGRSTSATVTVTVVPEAINDAFSSTSSGSEFDTLANDICDTCVITAIGPRSAGGSASISASGYGISYDPAIASGTETFTYTIQDALGSTSTATVTVTVLAPPSASNDTASTTAGSPVVVNVMSNDTCTNCSVEIAADPSSGSVVVLADGTIRFTPKAGFSGSVTFSYAVTDPATGLSATATVTVTVAPTATDDSAATTRDTAATIDVASNDDCTSCTLSIITGANNGSLVSNGTQVTYSPVGGFEGTDSFRYRVTDPSTGEWAEADVTVTVSNATADATDTALNTPVTIAVLNNDACVGCSAAIATQPANGTASSDGAFVTYTPNDSFWGIDTFSYTASDGVVSSSATVRVLVGPPARSSSIEANTTATGNLSVPTCAGCTFELVTPPTDGDLSIAADGSWEYTPVTDFAGTDTFFYRVTDPVSGLSRTGEYKLVVSVSRITVTVNVTNDDGGTAAPNDFLPTVNGNVVQSGTATVFAANTQYTVAQTLLADYANTSIVCQDTVTTLAVANPFTLQPGQNVECVISNNDISTHAEITIDLTKSLNDENSNSRPDAGETIDYTYTVTNSGAVTLTSGTVSDALGLGITCPSGSASFASLASGAHIVCTATGTITQSHLNAGTVANTATASASSASGAVSDTDAVSTSLTRDSAVSLAKTFTSHTDTNSNSRIDASESFTYTITATNTGNTTLSSVQIDDPLTGDTKTCATLAPTASCELTTSYTVTQAVINAGSVTNTATVTATAPDGLVSDSDTTTKSITQVKGLDLVKTAGQIQDTNASALHDAGDTVPYSYVVTNTGNTTLQDIAVTDDLIPTIVCDADHVINALAPGASETCTGEYVLTQADVDAGTVTNNAAATSGTTTATTSETKAITRASAVALVKSFTSHTDSNSNSRIDAGETFAYGIIATNTGNTTLTNVQIDDPLTADTKTCPTLAPGATCTLTTSYTATQAVIDAGTVTNTATVSASGPEGPASGSDSETKSIVRSNGVSLSNTWVGVQDTDADASADLGEAGRFSLQAVNTGNTTLTNVTIIDPATAATITCQTLAPGATCTVASDVTIDQTALDANEVSSSGSVTADTPQGGTVSDTASATGQLSGAPGISMQKSKTGTIDSNSSGRLDAGDTLRYLLTATNTGTVTLTQVEITDALTGGATTCATVAPSGTCSLVTDHVLTQADIDAGTVTNTGAVSASFGQSAVSASDSHTESLTRSSALELDKSFTAHTDANSNARIDAGETFTYTITATNTGNTTLSSVQIDDPLTADSKTCQTLAPGATCELATSYTVTQAAIDAGSVTNTATVEANAPDGPVSASDAASKSITAVPALSVVKTAGQIQDTNASALHDAGDTVGFDVVVTNTGNVELTNIAVTDALIPGMLCDTDATIDTLAPGASATCTGEYVLTQADVDAGQVQNTATAASGATTAQGSETVSITRVSTLGLVKAFVSHTDTNANSRVDASESFTYTITATNTGNTTLTNVAIDDPLTGESTTCVSLAPGEVCTLSATYVVTQDVIDTGSVTNNAAATATAPDGPVSSSDSETKSITRSNGIALQNTWVGLQDTDADAAADLGEAGRFSLQAVNTGNTTLTNVTIIDPATSATITCQTLAPGETCTVASDAVIDQTALDANEVSSTGSVTADTPQGGTVSDTASATGPLTVSSGLELQKTLTGTLDSNSSGRLDAGDTLRYLLTATNTGTVTLSQVEVSDALTGEATTCATVAPSGTCSLVTDYVLTQADIDAGTVTNTGSVTATIGQNSVTDTDSHTESLALDPAVLTGSKELTTYLDADSSGDVSIGDTLTYRLVARNDGPQTLSNVTLSDPLTGAEKTCQSLAPGATCETSTDLVVTESHAIIGVVTNTATFDADGVEPSEDTVTTPVNFTPAVSITSVHDSWKTDDATPTDRTDAGDSGTWRYVISNTGNITLVDLEFETPVSQTPSCESLTRLAPGASVTCTATRVLSQADLDAGAVEAQGRVTAAHRLGAPRVEAAAPLQTAIPVVRALTLTKSVVAMPGTCTQASASAAVIEGDEARWCFTLRNTGNVTLTDLRIIDTAIGVTPPAQPDGIPTSLAPGASSTVSVVVKHSATLTNSATATAKHGTTVVDAVTSSATLTVAPAFSVTGFVWFDTDRDGARDPREPYLTDVVVELQEKNTARTASIRSDENTVVRTMRIDADERGIVRASNAMQTQKTNTDGRYLFSRVAPGSYKVIARLALAGFKPLQDTDGKSDWEVGVSIVNAPVVADFASTGAASLGGAAAKRSGGVVPNAKLSCTWEGFDKTLRTADDVVFEAVANAAGEYEIDGVPFGELSCTATDPVTNAVEVFDASITAPGRVVENATFPAPERTPGAMPRTGSDTGSLLVLALLSTLLGAALVLLRRRTTS